MQNNSFYRNYGKRILDIIFSFLLIILLIPLFLFLSILIRIFLGSPVIFKQKRPGKNERIFMLYKFRTMNEKKDSEGKLLPDKDRLTRFGLVLRSSSLDELPELFNILKGDMSFVGPRPLLCEYLPLYSESQRTRHIIRPGLTGLAQVNGRNKLTWNEKFILDIGYVNGISLKQDFSILVLTIKTVARKDGINSKEGTTVEKFNGKN